MSLMREVPVTMLFENGRTSWFVFETDGIKRVDSRPAKYSWVELKGWQMERARCLQIQGYSVKV